MRLDEEEEEESDDDGSSDIETVNAVTPSQSIMEPSTSTNNQDMQMFQSHMDKLSEVNTVCKYMFETVNAVTPSQSIMEPSTTNNHQDMQMFQSHMDTLSEVYLCFIIYQ